MEIRRIPNKRLGRLRPETPPHLDPQVLHLADYVTKPEALPAVRPYRDWSAWAATQLGGYGNFGAMLNDQLGDCTCAAIGHAIQVVTAVDSKIVTPTDAEILTMYESSGYVPGNPSTDNGWYIKNALQYWQKTGLAGHKIDAFMAVNPQNQAHVDLAFELFGFVDIGVGLPITAQNQNGEWSVSATGLQGDGEIGSWGGHSVIVTKRSVTSPQSPGKTILRHGLITWGVGDWLVTPNFWQAYVDECWVAFSLDWLKGVGSATTSPTGLNTTQLLADLQAVAN